MLTKKIMIFGIPGSGKSTFALHLSEILQLPLHHLDRYFFIEGWKERKYEDFLEIQTNLVKQESWIIDGNAIKSLELRYSQAHMVLYFRFNRLLCLYRIFKRLVFKDHRISDRAEGCSECIRFRLIRYLWGFNERVRMTIGELQEKYPHVQFYEFHYQRDLSAFLDKMKQEMSGNHNVHPLKIRGLFDKKLESTSSKQTKKIIVVPYNPEWAKIFEREAVKIHEVLGSNCLTIHHIGSTSVLGLSAKPVIDMIGVVGNPEMAIQPLESLGFTYKGEYNIPMRLYFSRSEGIDVNLHIYKEEHPEIELNLLFRDYLQNHPQVRNEYAELKSKLLQEKSSYEKNHSPFTGYNLGKAAFISKILKAANFNHLRIMKCTHYAEWDTAKRLRQQYFFNPLSITDPYTWTFDHKEHAHLIFYKGVDIVGYAHIQFWPGQRAALRIIVIDEAYRHNGLGSQFLHMCEQWLKIQGILSLHNEVQPNSMKFYQKNGYTKMPFNDPNGTPTCPPDAAMGKIL
ncbi:MAG: GNAT family N-acetyltransferase [Chlamydiales bacterium]